MIHYLQCRVRPLHAKFHMQIIGNRLVAIEGNR